MRGACVSSYTQSRVFLHLLLIAYCISFPPFPPFPSPPPSYDQVFKSLSPIHHARTHTEPYCTDIIELPFSVFAMDHLSGVQDRHTYDSLEGTHTEMRRCYSVGPTVCMGVGVWMDVCVCVGMHVHLSFFY